MKEIPRDKESKSCINCRYWVRDSYSMVSCGGLCCIEPQKHERSGNDLGCLYFLKEDK